MTLSSFATLPLPFRLSIISCPPIVALASATDSPLVLTIDTSWPRLISFQIEDNPGIPSSAP